MVTVALDAMGGDRAPVPEVAGAVAAAREYGVRVLLVGQEDVLRAQLLAHPEARDLPIEIVHASERITMEDRAGQALRTKKDSSARVASRLVREGKAQGFVSAGNTGAIMAIAKVVQGMVPGVDRPALASAFPTLSGRPTVLIDVGANVDSTPRMLVQFAVMGEIYSRLIIGVERPRVGLLSIGEEEHKGNELTRSVAPLLRALPIHFIGNVEGRDLYTGKADVIICDGFVGNVALKVSEGLVDVLAHTLKECLYSSYRTRLGAWICKPAFQEFRRRLDYSEAGGAPLLGVKGVCVICHGSSNAKAIKNAIRVAAEFASRGVNARIEEELARWSHLQVGTGT